MFNKNIESRLIAILGPTNTGKTYLAFERLLSYQSGIFGFPLRLLARENYDKAIKKVGSNKVALITGEEKILPKDPKYFFCTVESMPSHYNVECIAIDEVQLSSDYERGYSFTEKILSHRGTYETIFLGSIAIKNILKKLFPEIKIETRNRFSKLSYSKKYSIQKIKPRSALIAFNVNKVYEIAETIRSIKGGTAVVLGSLSPRTRNAQVEIYENKSVDYLVATDAIGMGLNLNIDHIVFSSLKKFDGKYNRNLHPSEIGQIAGRAGRYQNEGTFGITKDAGFLDPLIIQSVEEHRFENIKKIYWRNSFIDFSSSKSVLNSLNQNPKFDFFIKKKYAEDEVSFRYLSSDTDVIKYLDNSENMKLLWNVCQIPDFQKIMNDSYIDLQKNIFLTLLKNNFLLPEEWIGKYVNKLDNFDGGIDELAKKIAYIRTWTYISNQSNWLKDKNYWQQRTSLIEDNLSDKLHESLTNRFIDNAATFFSTNNKDFTNKVEVKEDKLIKIDGQIYGSVHGFKLLSNENIKTLSNFTVNHVKKTIRLMIKEKINDFLNAPSDALNISNIEKLNLEDEVKIYWGDESVGVLKKGNNIYSPIVELINSEFVEVEQKELIIKKLQDWINQKISDVLKPINNNTQDINNGDLRSITYNLFNSLGTMETADYFNSLKNFSVDNKNIISKLGIRTGAKFFFMPNLLKKNAIQLKALLWKIFYNLKLSGSYPFPKDGRVSFVSPLNMPDHYWQSLGYLCINNFVVRVDVFERIFFLARKKNKNGPFLESSELMNPIGCNSEQLSDLLKHCGFSSIVIGNEKRLFFYQPKKKIRNIKLNTTKAKLVKTKKNKKILKEKKPDPNSPFAVLQKLL